MPSFIPDPSWPTILELATKLWGEPTAWYHGGNEARFGKQEAKSVLLKEMVWKDHEPPGENGGYVSLHLKAIGPLPPRPNGTNGHAGKLKPWEDVGPQRYPYYDADGVLILEVYRTLSGSPRFRQRRPDPSVPSGWRYRVRDIPGHNRMLYRLPELLAAPTDAVVFVVEGEKDADNLAKLGLTVTTNIGGAGKWRGDYTHMFDGRCVVILPDNDTAGEAHAATVAGSLAAVTASLKVLMLPGLLPKGDVSDWLASGGTADALQQYASETPEYLPPAPQLPRGRPVTPTGDWRDLLLRSGSGRPLAHLGNAVIALGEQQEWGAKLRWNDFSGRPELAGTAVSDTDILRATAWLNTEAEINVASRVAFEAIRLVADRRHVHPVRDYLGRLQWDGTSRIAMWLTDHLGAADTELHRAFASRWMIGVVARVMRPGCQFDTALILESQQGLGKSTAFRALAGEWFTDHLPDLTNKDAMTQIQGVWIVELAELDSIRRVDAHRIKSFLSARIDRYRPPYGTMATDFPRQCSFGGTVNPSANGYLRDETGARRFWCVACGSDWGKDQKADIERLAEARDQLWAEANVKFHQGHPWHLDSTELEDAQSEAAEARQETDAREPKIQQYIWGRKQFTMAEILGPDCLNMQLERQDMRLQADIGRILASLKCRRDRIMVGGERRYVYYPKP